MRQGRRRTPKWYYGYEPERTSLTRQLHAAKASLNRVKGRLDRSPEADADGTLNEYIVSQEKLVAGLTEQIECL